MLQAQTTRFENSTRSCALVCAFACATLLSSAWSGKAEDFQFVVIGDTRPTFESENFRRFESVIPRIHGLAPALVINLGDLIYGYGILPKRHQWDRYQKVIQSIQPPYYQVPGNHDTYSREARRIYAQRFGKFFESFDHGDCHFVLLDNTERGRWGYMGPAQLDWLKRDLERTRATQVFVFMHFPVWDPDRVTPRAHDFWAETLHPLFRESRVKAVFGGHYHSYGPTREFDGIRYFITGGGGAELRPDYKRSGGEFHFMRVMVSDGRFDVRVVTDHGEMADTEADVMGGLQFGERNSSRIGIKHPISELQSGVVFQISLHNPDRDYMTGKAAWEYDQSSFWVEPKDMPIQVSPGATQTATFTLKALTESTTLQSLPRLVFNVFSGGRRHRFHREIRFLQEAPSPFQSAAPRLDGDLREWGTGARLSLSETARADAELRTVHTAENLYLGVTIPDVKSPEEEESPDELQVGLARKLSDTTFGPDFLRLGFNRSSSDARNRTPGRRREGIMPGIRSGCQLQAGRKTFEIAIPMRLLKHQLSSERPRLILNLSFRLPDPANEQPEPEQPPKNSYYYAVRYGSDVLLPVHYVELDLSRKPGPATKPHDGN